MENILLIGCGYSGERLARRHLERGDSVHATTRNSRRAAELQALGIRTHVANMGRKLPPVDRVYYTAPPPPDGDTDETLAAVLALLPPPRCFTYFSTTGVYGDRGGRNTPEDSPLSPASARARRRVDAESRVLAWCGAQGSRAIILRIAAIYGPGRLPLERLRQGEPVPDPETAGPGNRIHVDDLVGAAMHLGDGKRAGTWNISDGNPLSVAEFNDLVADAAGLPRPSRVPLQSRAIPPGLQSFLRERRRIDNTRLLETGFDLRYANPADGIRASLAGTS